LKYFKLFTLSFGIFVVSTVCACAADYQPVLPKTCPTTNVIVLHVVKDRGEKKTSENCEALAFDFIDRHRDRLGFPEVYAKYPDVSKTRKEQNKKKLSPKS